MTYLKSALVLMRIPFSIYLMPVYWFALGNVADFKIMTAVHVFIILHLLVYPASNGYNSYFDKDTESIGGLKKPPKVQKELLWMVVLFDLLAIAYSLYLNLFFAFLVTIYLLVSKAYSNDKIRLKKYPMISTAMVTIFQGAFTYFMIQIGLGLGPFELYDTTNLSYGMVSTLFLCGSYPLTQAYQHAEDAKRGDKTLSIALGINGTFVFAGMSFLLAAILLSLTYWVDGKIWNIPLFLIFTAPSVYYFFRWYGKVKKDIEQVNYRNTMKMVTISAICLNLFFIVTLYGKYLFY